MGYNFRKASVLIVEDNGPMLELVSSVVTSFGFENVYTARDGKEGFDVFCEHNPDLVIADWMMKPINGIALARMIRHDHKSPNFYVPIILMTGFSHKKRVLEARDSGITEFIVKPFKAGDLYKRIEHLIESPRQFVRAPDFFGPDRRRKSGKDHCGPFRRQSDSVQKIIQKKYELTEEDLIYKEILRSHNNSSHDANDSVEIDFVDRS